MQTQTANTANTLKSNYPAKIYIGEHDGEKIYLSAPSWDCDWYWGFGYLGNKNTHYHVDGLTKHETYNHEKKCFQYEFTNLFDGFKKHFGATLVVRTSQLWTLCELFKTFYTLKETAEVLGRGGAHYTNNPCKDVIINTAEATRINSEVLPAIFEAIYKILIPAQENEKINKQLVKLVAHGEDTLKIIDFMKENNIHTDDLKDIKEITDHDFKVIHTRFWAEYHANKNK